MLNIAYAQEAQAQGQQGGFASLIPLVLVFAVFYFLMIRPQKKKLMEEQEELGALKDGDEIYTKSGMLGKIVGGTDRFVTLEIAEGVRIKQLRSQLGGRASKLVAPEKKA